MTKISISLEASARGAISSEKQSTCRAKHKPDQSHGLDFEGLHDMVDARPHFRLTTIVDAIGLGRCTH